MIDPNKEYTRDEIAEHFGVHRHTVWRWIKAGKIKGQKRKINRLKIWYFPGDEVKRFIGRHQGKTLPPTLRDNK